MNLNDIFSNHVNKYTVKTTKVIPMPSDRGSVSISGHAGFFYKYTTLAIMPILASDSLLRENKKSDNKMLPLVGIEPLA